MMNDGDAVVTESLGPGQIAIQIVSDHGQIVDTCTGSLSDADLHTNPEPDGSDADPDDPGEPQAKRLKISTDCDLDELDMTDNTSLKQILFNINKAVCLRLDSIELDMRQFETKLKGIDDKMDQVIGMLEKQNMNARLINLKRGMSPNNKRGGAVIVGLPSDGNGLSPDSLGLSDAASVHGLGPNVTLITLNTEEDFPNGSWLGDENNPEMRVRVPITPSDLIHIHSNCRTQEKMALTLLDYLFDRDTQAESNLSGMGKHGKQQLDPLMIYGVRCHLIHRFCITEADWHRVKQNLDSKCRTAYRRRTKGMPIAVKAFRGKSRDNTNVLVPGEFTCNPDDEDEDSMQSNSDLQIESVRGSVVTAVASLSSGTDSAGIEHNEIQILHATPEQISQLQHAQHIQILHGDHVIQQIQGEGTGGVQVSVAVANHDMPIATVTTGTGEVLHIHQSDLDHASQ